MKKRFIIAILGLSLYFFSITSLNAQTTPSQNSNAPEFQQVQTSLVNGTVKRIVKNTLYIDSKGNTDELTVTGSVKILKGGSNAVFSDIHTNDSIRAEVANNGTIIQITDQSGNPFSNFIIPIMIIFGILILLLIIFLIIKRQKKAVIKTSIGKMA